MSPRTVAEVESSLEKNREELEQALAELQNGLRQVTDVRSRVEHYRSEAVEVVERNRDHLGVFAAWFGFVVGGGVSGVLRLPFRLMRVVLGRPARLEVRMRRDRHSRQLAGALVALATADRQLRRRRGLIWRSIRRTAVVAPAFGAAWVYMVSDEDRFQVLEKTADQVLDRVEHASVLERVLSP